MELIIPLILRRQGAVKMCKRLLASEQSLERLVSIDLAMFLYANIAVI
jgi:hypothetical protein